MAHTPGDAPQAEDEPTPEAPDEALIALSTLPTGWELRLPWGWPSALELEARIEERIRRRWPLRSGEPPADVFVYRDEIWVEVDLPGVQESDVSAYLEQGAIVIEATRRLEARAQQARPARMERAHGQLRRRVPLPAEPGAARLELRLEAGVLRVRIVPLAEP